MPGVAPLFFSFRIMVVLGFTFIVLFATFFWLSARRRLERHRWLLRVAVGAIPLGWVAVECGWFVAEYGRQPWVVEGVLPTAAAVSELSVGVVLTTILLFAAIYSVLLVIEIRLMLKAIRKGPNEAEHGPDGLAVAPPPAAVTVQ